MNLLHLNMVLNDRENYIRFFLYILWAIPNLTVTREPSKLEVQQIIPFLSELFLIYHSQSFFFLLRDKTWNLLLMKTSLDIRKQRIGLWEFCWDME